jgi:hypothetical protein
MDETDLQLLLIIHRVTVKPTKLVFYKLKHDNGIKKQYKYAPAVLSSFDLSFTIHSSKSQSHDTIPLRNTNVFSC